MKNFGKQSIVLIAVLLSLLTGSCGRKVSTVAVVVDDQTYSKISGAVDKYVEAISLPDRKGVLVVDKWHHPDSIRAELYRMYCNESLEGAVFVGNIPVPMLRNAQHMTTAFKMDQVGNPWIECSVPSDRFYDDFDLKFDYLKQDSTNTLAHYYSLRADSPQKLTSDIYSARIKAPIDGNEDKAIEAYLLKAVEAHKNPERMDKVLHYGGYGYNSESLQARIDEAISFKEQFPFLNGHNGKLAYIDFNRDYLVRKRLMASLADKDLDFAILHHHGAPDTQYLQATPQTNGIEGWKDLIKISIRSNMRNGRIKPGQDVVATAVKHYGIPREWVADFRNPELVEKDSIFNATKYIVLEDMDDYKCGAKVVVLDACYNGAFIYDDYIAARYIFGEGSSTMVARANSVNTLQDVWITELVGLFNLGVCAGEVYRRQLTLEQHLFGDPTFAFAPQSELYSELPGCNISRDIFFKKNDVAYWRNILEHKSNDIAPELRVLAVKMLNINGAITSDELLQIEATSPYHNVRLEAFVTLCSRADEKLLDALKIGMGDSYELVRRLAVNTAAKNGSKELVPYIAKIVVDPMSSKREYHSAKFSLSEYDAEAMIAAIDSLRGLYNNWIDDAEFAGISSNLRRDAADKIKSFEELISGKLSKKWRIFEIEIERNKCSAGALDAIRHMVENGDEVEQVVAAEVLGWYIYSCEKEKYLSATKEMYNNAPDGALKNELLKSIYRLDPSAKMN